MSTPISSWTPSIKRGATFRHTLILTDDAGAPISLSTSSIFITPSDGGPLSWTQANGLMTLTSPGVYDIVLSAAVTASYTWSAGTYRWYVVETVSGDVNPCLIEGLIFVSDC